MFTKSTTTFLGAAAVALSAVGGVRGQVTATGTNGPTNPAAPTFAAIGSKIDQTGGLSRLVSLNSVNDFCLFGPQAPGEPIGNIEGEVVAYCTQPRNGARIIPDGTISSAHFIKTDMYVQISGTWDGTKVDIQAGDYGGELDPHGATGEGNPVGGNVTSDVTGSDVFYEEWMMYVSSDAFCLRICTAESANVSAALQCEHELDVLGCNWVMAIPYDLPQTFDECLGEPAAPPGLYPLANGSTSTFRQRYTGTYTDTAGVAHPWTVGQTSTPEAPYSYPATSMCTQYPSVSNGIGSDYVVNSINSAVGAIGTGSGNGSAVINTMNSTSAASTGASTGRTGTVSATITGSNAANTGAAASGASSSTSAGSAGSITLGAGLDSMMVTVGGITFAGIVAGMAVLL